MNKQTEQKLRRVIREEIKLMSESISVYEYSNGGTIDRHDLDDLSDDLTAQYNNNQLSPLQADRVQDEIENRLEAGNIRDERDLVDMFFDLVKKYGNS